MSSTPSSLSPELHESVESATASTRASDAPRVVLNLTDSRLFGAEAACVLAPFGAGPVHSHEIDVECDLDRAVAENAGALVRSRRVAPADVEIGWGDLIFAFGPQAFVHADFRHVSGLAADRATAEKLALDFTAKYKAPAPPDPKGGLFQLIKVERNQIDTVTVALDADTILTDDMLDLHYGGGFLEWHRNFAHHLPDHPNGISVFQGPPGTGKTSYLRHLMGVLKDSHRFYFVQPSHMHMLAKPEFVQFWVDERRCHSDRRFIVILEDAEEAIMRRGTDNSAQVSAILNLSDGLLGDFVRLHVICTMNCAATDVDPALLRPGRLLGHRVFNRLDRPAATRLAKQLGKELPTASDYSLAEIFAGHVAEASRPRIGFAA